MTTQNKQGRNDICACGSGKKFKQCCMLKSSAAPLFSSASLLKQAIQSFEEGNYQSAIGICQHILNSEPDNFSAMTLLGVLVFYAGNLDSAIQILEKSLAIQPKQPDAHNNLGEIFRSTGNFQSALRHFQEALLISPKHLGALINCGNCLQDVYRYSDAIKAYQAALVVMPNHTGALSNLANIFQQLYQHESAIEVFSKLLKIDPDFDWALGGKLYSQIHNCNWTGYEKSVNAIIKSISLNKRAIKPFELLPISDDLKLELEAAKVFAKVLYPSTTVSAPSKLDDSSRIRIAYLSADFRTHPVSQLLVGVIEHHDRANFEIIGVSFGPDDHSLMRARIANAFDEFIDVHDRSDEQVAELLKSKDVHIAIDLMGYTTHARPAIFTHRPAPIQVLYLGYAGTCGSKDRDYVIADETIIPAEFETYYSEQVIRLPTPFLPRDPTPRIPPPLTRLESGLPEEGFVFCAFNNHYKITPSVFDVWMRLLKNVEGSVLWLSAASATIQKNLSKEAESRGINPSRLIFAERTPQLEDHLARHVHADLFLDTFPYNAHTTASDALWVGLPVLTMKGKSFASRVAASLLQSLNMHELVSESLLDYESIAIDLATNPDKLLAIKAKLSNRKYELDSFNVEKYTKNLEDIYVRLATSLR